MLKDLKESFVKAVVIAGRAFASIMQSIIFPTNALSRLCLHQYVAVVAAANFFMWKVE